MKKMMFLAVFFSIVDIMTANAQYGGVYLHGGGMGMGMGGGGYYRRSNPRQQRNQQQYAAFKPTIDFSLGYGFPNLDKQQLAAFYSSYRGTASQTGPVFGSIDYHFTRFTSIGVMASYGKVSAPYYDYNQSSTAAPAFTGSLTNWSFMVNLISYMPTYNINSPVTPYLRTAIGVNNWTKNYEDASGNKMNDIPDPATLAYQVSLGAKFKFTPVSEFFIEAGYGKYILSAGLSFKL